MKTLTFVVKEPRRPDTVIEVEADRMLLGSGAHCDIRLPLESAAWEHVVVTQEGEGAVIARVVPADAVAFFNGTPRREAELAAGTVIRIDTVEVLLRDVRDNTAKPKRSQRPRAAVVVAALIGLAAALVILKNASAGGTPPPPKMPELFTAKNVTCPEKQGALPLAYQKLSLARSKRERFRFYPRDGVEAVALFDTAAACFASAKDASNARIAEGESAALKVAVQDALHGSRVRLERALVRKDARTALAQVKFQRDLLKGEPDGEAYGTWLALLESQLESLVSKES
jgi:hypothetical protein